MVAALCCSRDAGETVPSELGAPIQAAVTVDVPVSPSPGTIGRRVAWLDCARGIGIMLVVAGHVERGLWAAGLARGRVWPWFDYTIYTFHMPLFFLLAGVHVPRGLARGKVVFLRNKLLGVAYPYLLWSLLQGSVLVACSSLTNGTARASDLLRIGWQPMSQFWFLYVLFGCHLLALLLGMKPRLSLALAALGLAAGHLLPLPAMLQKLLLSFPYFAAGFVWSEHWLRPTAPARARRHLLIGVFGFIPAVALSAQPGDWDPDSLWALPASVLGLAALINAAHLLRGRTLGFCASLGRASMTIYVLHILAAAGLRIGLRKLGVPAAASLYFTLCTCVGVALPWLIHHWLERHELLPWFGLGPRPARPRAQTADASPALTCPPA